MNKTPLLLLIFAPLALPIVGAVAAPVNAPKWAPKTTADCDRSVLLRHFDLIPGKEFAGFGGVNRRSLLKRKGAVVDTARNYIMIPGSANPNDGNLRMVQISLLGQGKKPLVAVSRVMFDNSNGVDSTLRFYFGYADGKPVLRTAAKSVFPYSMGAHNYAELPQRGTTLVEYDASGQSKMNSYRWDGGKFRFYRN